MKYLTIIQLLCLVYSFGLITAYQDVNAGSEPVKTFTSALENTEQFRDDVVVADAVFQGVYVGIVRMIQRVSDDDSGAPSTTVMVRVKHSANDSTTTKHMWHVEHDPITGVNCAAVNKHFAPFNITKQDNYTTYCSGNSPDYCEIGDISTKTTLTSIGKNVVNWYSVPMLPVVGPWTVIGHSVNIHGGDKSKIRQACGNIALNTRMTPAQVVPVNVKITGSLSMDAVREVRIKMAEHLKLPLSKIQTAGGLADIGTGCKTINFLVFGRGTFDEKVLTELKEGKRSIGVLSPVGCSINGKVIEKNDFIDTCGGPADEENPDIDDGDFVYADAVFRGVYVGVVRMRQKVSSIADGYPVTEVMVRLKHAANDSTSSDHMWHVEHDPVADISCAAVNKHFAPFGITKQPNYTTYCSGNTPDYCEIGDISTKTTLTKVGKDVIEYYSVPLLPVIGPYTVLGHSVNVHGGNKSKVRQACANIQLNTRMTRAKVIDIPVNYPEKLDLDDLVKARIKMAKVLGVSIAKIHTADRLDLVGTGCTKVKFILFSQGQANPAGLRKLQNGDVDIGKLTPTGCQIDRIEGGPSECSDKKEASPVVKEPSQVVVKEPSPVVVKEPKNDDVDLGRLSPTDCESNKIGSLTDCSGAASDVNTSLSVKIFVHVLLLVAINILF